MPPIILTLETLVGKEDGSRYWYLCKSANGEVLDYRSLIVREEGDIKHRQDLTATLFDLFDSLGLNPLASTITPSAVQKAWRRVNLHLHPDKALGATHVPLFPSSVQARQAKDYLLGEEKGAPDAQARIRIALLTGKHSYRSTWNPWAAPSTSAVLKPIPGTPTVATHGNVASRVDWDDINPWANDFDPEQRAPRNPPQAYADSSDSDSTDKEADSHDPGRHSKGDDYASRTLGVDEVTAATETLAAEIQRAKDSDFYWRSTGGWSSIEERLWRLRLQSERDHETACLSFWEGRKRDRERREGWAKALRGVISSRGRRPRRRGRRGTSTLGCCGGRPGRSKGSGIGLRGGRLGGRRGRCIVGWSDVVAGRRAVLGGDGVDFFGVFVAESVAACVICCT
ncbi:hypothetical protein MMC34_004982 [Xylographa carneopallida]|nr:hypothetical protein [Xylographa carneopallida]